MTGGELFDPGKARGAAPPPAAATPAIQPAGNEGRPIKVSRLAEMIGHALADGLPRTVYIIGEVSGFRDRTHWYFDLKDEDAVISCIAFASAVRRHRLAPENGSQVIVQGRIDFFARAGKTQIYVERITPVGAGALELAYRKLCDELRGLGWFAPERKRPLPRFPTRVAVVTSRSSAALQDVIDTMKRRCCAVELLVADVRVQGPEAAAEIAATIDRISARAAALGIDALIVTRGGGSMEDLWAFNERKVGLAILNSAVPVVAAIGHETDTTIAELVADERCATPTQAAMRLTPDKAALSEQCERLQARLAQALRRAMLHQQERLRGFARMTIFADPMSLVMTARQHCAQTDRHARAALYRCLSENRARLDRAAHRLARRRPEAVYAAREARVEQLTARLRRGLRNRITPAGYVRAFDTLERAWAVAVDRRSDQLATLEREMSIAGPLRVLARGYSVTTDAAGRVLRSSKDAVPGQRISTRVVDGSFASTVGEAAAADAAATQPAFTPTNQLPPRRLPQSRRSRRRGRPQERDQLDLF